MHTPSFSEMLAMGRTPTPDHIRVRGEEKGGRERREEKREGEKKREGGGGERGCIIICECPWALEHNNIICI